MKKLRVYRFRTCAYKCRFGGTNEFLPSIVPSEILSSESERLRNFWCTPTVGWLDERSHPVVRGTGKDSNSRTAQHEHGMTYQKAL